MQRVGTVKATLNFAPPVTSHRNGDRKTFCSRCGIEMAQRKDRPWTMPPVPGCRECRAVDPEYFRLASGA